ncbi:MAG: VOC family protein [Candidatus Promineifilaceae bacterium]
MSEKYIRHSEGAVRPYLHGGLDLPEFIEYVFNAVEVERVGMGDKSYHVESRIEDAVVVIEAGELPTTIDPWTSVTLVYVPDVDAAYARAIERGATSIAEPVDKPYQERLGGFKDKAGNTWWVSTYTG